MTNHRAGICVVVGATVLFSQTTAATTLIGAGQAHGDFQSGQAPPQRLTTNAVPLQGAAAGHDGGAGANLTDWSVIGRNAGIIVGITGLYVIASVIVGKGKLMLKRMAVTTNR